MKNLIAANWKMNKTIGEAISFIEGLKQVPLKEVDVLICAPFTALSEISGIIEQTPILLGAQNMHYEDSGALTGQISPIMIKDTGATHVLVGHSEPRHIFNEDNELINKKVKAALKHGLTPVLCVGETLDERKLQKTEEVLKTQLEEGLKDIEDIEKLIIAYEPVWAISGGDPTVPAATPEDAVNAHKFIRNFLKEKYNKDTRILYGGSVKPENVEQLMKEEEINGGLVGGASLDLKTFVQLLS